MKRHLQGNGLTSRQYRPARGEDTFETGHFRNVVFLKR